MPTDLPPPTGFWYCAGRTASGVAAWLLLVAGVRLVRTAGFFFRHGIHAWWMFRLASAAAELATWLRPDLGG
jgi:hypothetical protein